MTGKARLEICLATCPLVPFLLGYEVTSPPNWKGGLTPILNTSAVITQSKKSQREVKPLICSGYVRGTKPP